MPELPEFMKWSLKRFRATVLNDIWPEWTFFTLVSLMVCLVSSFRFNLGVSPQLLTVVGTVLGLVVSFRTSSAYDRYWEGRKLWAAITLTSRNLSQVIWIHVPNERKPKDDPKQKTDPSGSKNEKGNEAAILRAIIEKKTMINLIQAYSVSLKHYLRGEGGIYYEDLYPLIAFLPRYVSHPEHQQPKDALPLWSEYAEAHKSLPHPSTEKESEQPAQGQSQAKPRHTHSLDDADQTLRGDDNLKTTKMKFTRQRRLNTFDPEKALPEISSDFPLRPARNPPKESIFDLLPFLAPLRYIFRSRRKGGKGEQEESETRTFAGKRRVALVESNVPLEICLFLSSYLAFLLNNDLLKPAMAVTFANQITAFHDCLTNMERVRNTPIPYAYQVHLRMSTWLYLIFLPFQIYNSFGYITIPATAFASFLILGFLEIGQEIENPFSYEANDLDLDGFCLAIQRELHEVTAHIAPNPADFIFSELNQPFAPSDRRTAETMVQEPDHPYVQPGAAGLGSLRKTMLMNWREVNHATKEVKRH